MHRDQKIGLSLAVLIVGFAGAFCFRNDGLSESQPLSLEQTLDLDARIEHLPIRAYTQREGVGGILQQADCFDSASDVVDVAYIDVPIQTVRLDDEPAGDLVELYAGPPEPLPIVERGVSTKAINQPADSRPAVAESGPPEPQTLKTVDMIEAMTSVESRTHVVQSGDTLSGISVQFYGTSRRYLDIYRANRGVLRDPDDLPVGTTLRIP